MASVILDKFSNGNPEGCVYRAEHYFKFLGFSEEDWLPLPYFYLEGDALSWFDWLFRNKQFYDWNHFKEKLFLLFRKLPVIDSKRRLADSSLAYHRYISHSTLNSSEAQVSPLVDLRHNSNFYEFESAFNVGNSEAKHVFYEMPTRAFTKAVNETSSVKAVWKSTDTHVSISNFAADLNDNQSPKGFGETSTTATSSIHFPSTVGSIPYLLVLKRHASGALFYDRDKSAIDEDNVFEDSFQSTMTFVTRDDISEFYISPMVDEKRDLESLNKLADLVDTTEDLDCKAKLMQEGANAFSVIPLAVAYGQSASNFFELEHLIEPDNNIVSVPDGVAHPETLGPKLSYGQMFDKIFGWNETGSLISLQLASSRTTFKYVLDHGGELVSTFNQLLLVKDCVTRFPFDPGADLFIVNLGGPVIILGVNFKTLSLTGHTEYMQAPLLMGLTVTSPAFHQYYSAEKDPSSDLIELKPGAEVVVNKVPKLFDQNFQKTNTKFARTGIWNISDDLILTINNQSRVELNDFQVCIGVDTGQIIEVGSFCFDLFINNSQDGICAKYEWWYKASNYQFYLNKNGRNVDALGGSRYFVGSNNEIINTVKTRKGEDKACFEQKIGEMDSRLDKFKEELRKVAGLEIVLYSVISEHECSVYKLHISARHLFKLYHHACKYWCLDKRATIVKNIVSSLVLISIILRDHAFQKALKRLYPVVNGWVLEQCVARLDGAKFNMVFHESPCEIPTVALYLTADSKELHIPALCFAALFSWELLDSRFSDPFLIGVTPHPHSSLSIIIAIISMLFYSNLEDMVLIEDGGIVMNENNILEDILVNSAGYVWDPG